MGNEYIEFGDLMKIVLKDGEGNVTGLAIIDKEDYDKVKDHKWHLTTSGYAIGYCKKTKTKFLLHVYIMGTKKGYIIDHIDGNKINCSRKNLRYITQSMNCHYGKLSSVNKSGKKGVSVVKQGNKTLYKACIQHKGTIYRLGTFKDFTEAVRVRQAKEIELLGQPLQY